MLERRERELTHELAGLKGEIDVRENELAHVRSARRQIDMLGGNDAARFGKLSGVAATGNPIEDSASGPTLEGVVNVAIGVGSLIAKTSRIIAEAQDRNPFLQFEGLTIKQLIVKALGDHFLNGASASELRDFIENAYDRNIERSSLTPQLSRLRDEGVVEYFQPQSETETGPKAFVVARQFNSAIRRFPLGAELVVPDDADALRILKKELEPRELEDLIKRRWIVPHGAGLWRLAHQGSNHPTLIEGKAG